MRDLECVWLPTPHVALHGFQGDYTYNMVALLFSHIELLYRNIRFFFDGEIEDLKKIVVYSLSLGMSHNA